jgi:hypothetical protein
VTDKQFRARANRMMCFLGRLPEEVAERLAQPMLVNLLKKANLSQVGWFVEMYLKVARSRGREADLNSLHELMDGLRSGKMEWRND